MESPGLRLRSIYHDLRVAQYRVVSPARVRMTAGFVLSSVSVNEVSYLVTSIPFLRISTSSLSIDEKNCRMPRQRKRMLNRRIKRSMIFFPMLIPDQDSANF